MRTNIIVLKNSLTCFKKRQNQYTIFTIFPPPKKKNVVAFDAS